MRRSIPLFGTSDNRPTPAFEGFLRDVQVPGDDLASIDAALQARFFQKGPDQQPIEPWELKDVQVSCPPEKLGRHLHRCGFIAERIALCWEYTYAAWPGALLPRATVRLSDLIEAWKSGVLWQQTIVFGGKRPLQPDKENPMQGWPANKLPPMESALRGELSTPSAQQGVETELDMMRWLWERVTMPSDLRALPTVFVDAPMKPPAKEGGPPVRPNTEDTVQEWLRSNPKHGSLLLSSGAPYGMAQDEAFAMLLDSHGITAETFGHAAPDLPAENLMREVAGAVNRIRKARKV